MTADQSAEIVLSVGSARYDSDHPAWRGQVGLLREQLLDVERLGIDDDGGEPAFVSVPLRLPDMWAESGDSTKGLLEISALMLASAQMARAAAVVIREWCKQDATRSVSFKVVRSDESVEMEGRGAAGANIAKETMLAVLESRDSERPEAGGEVR